MMQQAINVMEDVALRDSRSIGGLELRQRPVGDVLAPIRPILVIGAEREALRAGTSTDEMEVRDTMTCEHHEWFLRANVRDVDSDVLRFACWRGEEVWLLVHFLIEDAVEEDPPLTEGAVERPAELGVTILGVVPTLEVLFEVSTPLDARVIVGYEAVHVYHAAVTPLPAVYLGIVGLNEAQHFGGKGVALE